MLLYSEPAKPELLSGPPLAAWHAGAVGQDNPGRCQLPSRLNALTQKAVGGCAALPAPRASQLPEREAPGQPAPWF